MSTVRTFLAGLCIGLADLLPGISGGTVAIALGLYPCILEALKSLSQPLLCRNFRKSLALIPWGFLLSLMGGMALAWAIGVHIVYGLLSHPLLRQWLYAAFVGMVAASAMQLLVSLPPRQHLMLAVLACVLATMLPLPSSSVQARYTLQQSSYNIQELELMRAKGEIDSSCIVYREGGQDFLISRLTIFLSGMMAIAAALLPGLSGSYCLNMLGVYPAIIGALAQVTSGLIAFTIVWPALELLTYFALGVIAGGLISVRLLTWCLKSYRAGTTAILAGFMFGTMGSLWPFWSSVWLNDKGQLHLLLLAPVAPTPLELSCGLAFSAIAFYLTYRLSHSSMAKVFSNTSFVQ